MARICARLTRPRRTRPRDASSAGRADSQTGIDADATMGVARLVCQPRRRRPCAGLLGDVVRDGEDAQLLGLGAGDEPGQAGHQVLLLVRRAKRRVDRGDLVESIAEPGERLGVAAGHTLIQASSTDTPAAQNPLFHRGIQHIGAIA